MMNRPTKAGQPEHSPRRRLTAAERRARIEAAATRLIAERGYDEAPVDAIARAAGITPPVLYDHFPSKPALYEAVLRSHFANLRAIWQGRLSGAGLSSESVAASFDAWFAYVEAEPDAARVLFRRPSAPEAAAIHRVVSDQSRDLVLPLLTGAPRGEILAGSDEDLEMTWVVLRGVLQGLALWWVDHPGVARERVVGSALVSLWTGYGRIFEAEDLRGG